MDAIAEEPSGEDSTSNDGSEHNAAAHMDSTDNIKLQRVTGVSMRHKKPPPASVIKEGWMVHYTNKSTLVCMYISVARSHSLNLIYNYMYICLCESVAW